VIVEHNKPIQILGGQARGGQGAGKTQFGTGREMSRNGRLYKTGWGEQGKHKTFHGGKRLGLLSSAEGVYAECKRKEVGPREKDASGLTTQKTTKKHSSPARQKKKLKKENK